VGSVYKGREHQKIEIRKNLDLIVSLEETVETSKNMDLIDSLEKTVAKQEEEINHLRDQIDKLKRVDLGIEEKKQKSMQQNESI